MRPTSILRDGYSTKWWGYLRNLCGFAIDAEVGEYGLA